MRNVLLFFALVCVVGCACGFAQSAGDGWQSVRQLRAGSTIYVKARTGSRRCNLASVDDAQLTCHGSSGHPVVVRRTEIQLIKLARRSVSAPVGLLIGAGAGAGIGAAASSGDAFTHGRTLGAAVGAVFGGIGGLVIGYVSDFAKGPVIYGAAP